MRLTYICFLVVLPVFFIAYPLAPIYPNGFLPVNWKIGEMWNLEVEAPGKPAYIVHAIIGGVATVDGAGCWQITFLPGNGAPAQLKDKRHRVLVSQKTGQPVRALKVVEKQPIAVESGGGNGFITGLPGGMPIEWFNVANPPLGKFPIQGTTRALEIRKKDLGDHFIIEQALFDNGVEQWSIRQEWGVDEKWWHTYERIEKGQITLTAQRMNAAPFKSQSDAKPDPGLAPLATKFPLRMDLRLRAHIGPIGPDVKVAGLLERVHSETGQKLVLAENLTYHDPKFADVAVADAPAWMAMELLSVRDLDAGKWVKTAQGYELTGVSKLPAPVKLPQEGVSPEPEARSGGVSPWLVGGGAALGVALLGFAILLFLRRPRRIVADSPRKSPKTRGRLR